MANISHVLHNLWCCMDAHDITYIRPSHVWWEWVRWTEVLPTPSYIYTYMNIYIHIIVTTMHSLDLSVLKGDFDCWLSGVLEEFASQSPGWEVNVISLQHYDKMHWKKKGTSYQAPFLLIEIWGISSYGHIESTTLLKHVLFSMDAYVHPLLSS